MIHQVAFFLTLAERAGIFKCVIVAGWGAQSGHSGNDLSKQVHHTLPEAQAAPWPIKNMSVRVVSDFFFYFFNLFIFFTLDQCAGEK